MKRHTKKYFKHHNITEGDFIACKICGLAAQDIHHVHIKGMGGRKKVLINKIEYDIDDPINLIALCRKHHIEAHAGRWTKQELIDLDYGSNKIDVP